MTMSTLMRRVMFVCVMFASGAVASAQVKTGGTTGSVVHRFRVSVAASLRTESQGAKQSVAGDTQLVYNWARAGEERVLRFESIVVKTGADGKESLATSMSRQGIVATQDGRKSKVLTKDAPPDQKAMLLDCFGSPLCRLQVDRNGREVRRTVTARPGATSMIENGMLINALLFLPPFMRDAAEWQAPGAVALGKGGSATGVMTYRKEPSTTTAQTVAVSGTLTNVAFSRPGAADAVKRASYVVKGEQTFDPGRQEWVSGKLEISVDVEFVAGPETVALTGTITASFKELRDGK